MTTTQIDYEKVFRLFSQKDGLRQEMNNPFKQNGKYFATDAYSMIFMPIEKAELNFVAQSKPDATAIIPRESNCNIEIKVADIERQLIPDMIDETIEEEIMKKCTECDGDKVVECDLGHDHECVECDGTGETEDVISKPTGKKIPNPSKLFKTLGTGETGFQYCQLRRLIDACKMMGVETITKTFGTPRKGNVFQCGETIIIVMPALIDELQPDVTTIII